MLALNFSLSATMPLSPSSGVIATASDATCQLVVEKQDKYDWPRTFRFVGTTVFAIVSALPPFTLLVDPPSTLPFLPASGTAPVRVVHRL